MLSVNMVCLLLLLNIGLLLNSADCGKLARFQSALQQTIDAGLFGGAARLRTLPQSAFSSFFQRRNSQATAPKCNSVTRQGVCIDALECLASNGEVGGLCNDRSAACCIYYTPSCMARNERQVFTWISPPGTKTSCQASIVNQDTTCQIRLDFDTFSIAQPDSNSVCSTDKLTISGALYDTPVLCGNLVGQHMYLTPQAGKDIVIRIDVDVKQDLYRAWKIRMTRIACGSSNLAPDNCLQYFQAPSGLATSFNYYSIENKSNVTRQLAKQNYNICVKPLKGYCSICYSACPSVLGKPNTVGFSLSGDTSVANQTVGHTDAKCSDDYLTINGGYDKTNTAKTASKYCGGRLSAVDGSTTDSPVCTKQQPYSLSYSTNDKETGDDGNLGFCIQFEQVMC